MKLMIIKDPRNCCLTESEIAEKKILYTQLMKNLGDTVEFFEDDTQEISAQILQMLDMDIVVILPGEDWELKDEFKNIARIAQKMNKAGYILEKEETK